METIQLLYHLNDYKVHLVRVRRDQDKAIFEHRT